MQGRLRKEKVSIAVTSECAHCKKPMHIEIDSDMNYRPQESGCNPMVFVPEVDFRRLKEPNIIDAF
ncbi:MAG: hypothetical protein NTY51_10700 [Deltaproteobacteria bacterium]|nr:hypothetical protein [Deltaproteobacteria bacterium]